MRTLTGAVLALFLCVHACVAAMAATPAPNALRLGWISRYNRGMQPDPIVDRYVGNIRAAIADAANATTVDLPGTPLAPDDYLRFCKTLHLRGFIESAVGFRSTAVAVAGSAFAVVTDCDGAVFFADAGQKLEPRNAAEVETTQRDEVEQSATLVVRQKFLGYRAAHQTDWTSMLANGWVPANPAPAQLTMARMAFFMKNYGATLTMCSEADARVRGELSKARILFSIGHPATTDREYALGRIEDVINLDYLQAAANQKLGNADLTQQPELEGAQWVITLDNYVREQYPDETARPFTYLEGRITEMRAQYTALSPSIFKAATDALSRSQ